MRGLGRSILAVCAVITTACSALPPPQQASDVGAIAGKWRGTFVLHEGGGTRVLAGQGDVGGSSRLVPVQ